MVSGNARETYSIAIANLKCTDVTVFDYLDVGAYQLVMDRSYQFDLNLCHKSREKKTEFTNDNMAMCIHCAINEFQVVKDGSISMLTMVNEGCVSLILG